MHFEKHGNLKSIPLTFKIMFPNNLWTTDTGGDGESVHLFGSIPDLYPLDASSTNTHIYDNKKMALDIAQCYLGSKITSH